ncbi:MAG: hypothetical protein GY869_13495 [Planctomycetes bacterium]|nr:hypothetical protein [Planctomycetota bacterium]
MRCGLFGIFLVLFVLAGAVWGQADFVWNNKGVWFDDPCNWTPEGPPGGGDRAVFDLAAAYRVEFGGDFTNERLFVEGSEVEFDLGGYGYVLQKIGDYAVIIGDYADSRLKVSNGNINVCESTLGFHGDITAGLVVSSGATWEGRLDGNWYGMSLGQIGRAELLVEEGGILRHGHGWAATTTDGEADIRVTGAGSEWTVDG